MINLVSDVVFQNVQVNGRKLTEGERLRPECKHRSIGRWLPLATEGCGQGGGFAYSLTPVFAEQVVL
jgi:hypothetical protein